MKCATTRASMSKDELLAPCFFSAEVGFQETSWDLHSNLHLMVSLLVFFSKRVMLARKDMLISDVFSRFLGIRSS